MNNQNVPKHIGIIMDGNGRWAIKKGKSRLFGHKAGIDALKRIIDAFIEFKIDILSIYAFSTENWKRPEEEVNGIFNLINDFCDKDLELLNEKNIKIRTMGDISKLPRHLIDSLNKAIKLTEKNNGLILNIGLNYGARAEIVRAVNLIINENIKNCTEQDLQNHLYTYDLPDPDLIIRASGENRLSNFMLYQCAYSEFYFPKVHWPDFNKKQIQKAIKVYQKRNRRFGGLK